MILRAILTVSLVLFAISPALAGDLARRAVIGFSPDGSQFAFEEYGRQDGSGFPYANIYVIDVVRDTWVADSPKRVTLQDESASIDDARGEARQQARFLVQQYDLTHEGDTVATNIFTHENADPYKVVVYPRLIAFKTIDNPITLTIDQYTVEGDPLCQQVASGDTKGFRLTFEQDGASRVLHEDATLPESRSCPLDYRIHDVITYHPQGAAPVLVVIVQVMRVGFEGPDGRFIAVTSRF